MAEIVSEVTDGGRRIVEFYLGVADGSLDGFEDRHRMSAARRLDKIAPGLVAGYLQEHYNDLCRDGYRGSRVLPTRRSPIRPRLAEDNEPSQRRPNLFQRKLAQLVREETGEGRAIVYFMAGVMHGTQLGFKPYHRMEAAKELAAYVTSSPSPSTEERREPALSLSKGESGSPAVPTKTVAQKPGDSSVVPAKAGTQRSGAGRGSSPSPSTEEGREPALSLSKGERASPAVPTKTGTQKPGDSSVVPAKAGTQRSGAGRGSHSPTRNSKPKTRNFPPITIQEIERYGYDSRQITGCRFARDQVTGAVYAFDDQGPFEVDDDGEVYYISPDLIVGYGNVACQTFDDSELEEWLARKGTGMKLITGPSDASPGTTVPRLTPAERRIRERLDRYWHDPNPRGAPVDSASPGRSPPW